MPDVTGRERAEVYYSGRVQGVGFRYTVLSIAARRAVTGFVKNLSDGRVQVVAEGSPDELQRFSAAIDAEMGRYIRTKDEKTSAATGQFSRFDVRF